MQKSSKTFVGLLLITSPFFASGQGAFVYDQQSSIDYMQGAAAPVKSSQLGQSFIPTLSSVGFIRLNFRDHNLGNSLGATVYLNLRSGSITGTVLAASSPVFMPDGFGYLDNGVTNCLFIPPVPVIPGTTYYFDVNVLSGDEWDVDDYHYHYTNGTEFLMGQPYGLDLWFREGIIVPLVSNPVRNENGSVTIRGSMLPSTTNVTQVATNLIQLTSWQNLATNIADTNGTWQVTDSAATNQPVRFYRAVTL